LVRENPANKPPFPHYEQGSIATFDSPDAKCGIANIGVSP
jgi:hypothetical protein